MNKQPKYKIDNARLSRLVAKAQNGSRKAMEDVINMVSGYLYYYSLTLLGDEEQAKDAVQDILLTILKKLDTLDEPKAFLGWMKTIAANYCKTKLSRTKEHISIDEDTW
ncbi:MAG: sigma-70 family RNA polymerase sigma factor [Ruminococcus sp.]|nr:sigma-70 family RNA polymerase sigma factor [Ruminococcus sp.]MBQ1594465.1 sigma-70 family RNA polymerase sigma factor [Ruminococcus sp.]MBQ1921347.1 sigma-70 family RNA polymerase sigma factor [Ruminococcus sp.]MBQ4172483.1 sigma-70 family RNA polymerase sigma factor [Ruminococcus sp.]MBR0338397.1 sigma-70 family RNA polymerase sigma factor [Ruminococcus sp.]